MTEEAAVSLGDLFEGVQDVRDSGRPTDYPRPYRGRTPKEEAEARLLLSSVWLTIRSLVPTDEEVRDGTWVRDRHHWGPYTGTRPPLLYVNDDEHERGSLGRWDGNAIMLDRAWWNLAPKSRLELVVHEALHAVGFVHSSRGTGRRYGRVVSRAKRALRSAPRGLEVGEEGARL